MPPIPVRIAPAKLIETARSFADHRAGGRGRPRPIWLRRAVSTAYYALYHHISQSAAAYLLPSATDAHRLQLARSYSHAAIKEACEWVSGRRGKPPADVRPLVDQLKATAIADAAAAFCDLQESRHRADYDSLAPFTKVSALASVQDAEKAINLVEQANAADREAFFALLTLRTAIRK